MKKLAALFTAAAMTVSLGIAAAEEEGHPWQQKEATPLLKSRNTDNKKKETRKERKERKKREKQEKKKKKKKSEKKKSE